jgi:hypothetical protein
LLFVQETRDRFTIVTLTEEEYFDTIERTAPPGMVSGRGSIEMRSQANG